MMVLLSETDVEEREERISLEEVYISITAA